MSFILYLLYIILIIGPIYLAWAIYRINYRIKKVQWMMSQEYTVLRIDVPRMNDKAPLSAEQMFATIHGIYSESAKYQYHLSFEIVSKEKYIQFFVYLPAHLRDFVESQVYAQYPNVEIHKVEDYASQTDFAGKNYAIAEFALNKPDVYPIKQFTDFEVDPISAITSVMSQQGSNEEIWFQMIIRPRGDRWQEKGHSRINAVRSGRIKPTRSGFGGLLLKELSNLAKGFVAQSMRPGAESTEEKEVKLTASVEEALKGIEQKITKLGFETKIRVLALGSDPVSTRSKCQNVCAAFKQFNTTNLNGFKIKEVKINDTALEKDFVQRSFEDEGNIFNIAELASLYHFPSSTVSTPNIVWSNSKKGEPPANLPIRDNIPEKDFTVLGQTNFRNLFTEFGIKRDDRRRHIYIVGKSGVGKSVLIENMAINDVQKGSGVIIVDPHGELAEKVLACIPDDRVDDVVVFDPSDREFPIAFNVLEAVDDDFKSLVASGFIGIFKKIFGNSWGPRLEHILRNTVLALLDNPGSTMLDIPRMLTNSRFRDKVLENVKDTVIREFWLNEFASFDSKFRTEAVAPILNKVGQFLASSTIRNIVGQPKSTIDIREIMDQEKIMIVNLSRGKIGEDNSALLGAMMITKIQLAAMSRANVTIDKRPDCFLYVDEFQNFATDAFAVILSEARKYNLGLTMAHQYITQLPEELRNAIFGNAGTLISFRVGGADADVLVKEFEPVFETNDLVNLEKFHIYIKLLVDGISAPAFSARTLPPVQKLTANIDKVTERSHNVYSSPRVKVEEMINSKSTQEDSELKAEAEAFKKGGLEAILLRKTHSSVTPVSSPAPLSSPTPTPTPASASASASVSTSTPSHKTEGRDTDPKPKVEDGSIDVKEAVSSPSPSPLLEASDAIKERPAEDNDTEESKAKEPKFLKYQNILDGKIYKERTARGGVKWFLGEEIDEEKLAKSGTIIDDNGHRMIELTQKISAKNNKKKSNNKQKNKEDRGEQSKVPQKNADKPADKNGNAKQPKTGEPMDESQNPKDKDLPKQSGSGEKSVITPLPNSLHNPKTELVHVDHSLDIPKHDLVPVPELKASEEMAIPKAPDKNQTNRADRDSAADPSHLEEGKVVKLSE